MQIPFHEGAVERVRPHLHPSGQIYGGAVRYGDYFQAVKGLRWWVWDVNGRGQIMLRNDRLTTPQVCQVSEVQLRTCFRLSEERAGGRVALRALPPVGVG